MTTEVKVPLLPESIIDATVSAWHKKQGDSVSRDENIVDLETDKVMLEVPSPVDGIIKEIVKSTGSVVYANEVLAVVTPEGSKKTKSEATPKKEEQAFETAASEKSASATEKATITPEQTSTAPPISPSARRAVAEHEVDVTQIMGTGKDGRITKENVAAAVGKAQASLAVDTKTQQRPTQDMEKSMLGGVRPETRVPMSRIRTRIAERLLEVKQNTAMLTTFNDINMAKVLELRQRYREKFEKKYQTRLGFMSFFVRACVEALKQAPIVNASIDGNDIVYHGYYDVGIAVSTDRGLVVPVLRDADKMSMADIEGKIAEYADKARQGKLTLEEMQGGTFTITNGGVFGSLMATPILNSPQCAILGMHKIQERPVAENGQVVIRPMMYVALSYDHRLIDGKESVTFLVAVKELLEDPSRLILEV